jgi:hypothetical protein
MTGRFSVMNARPVPRKGGRPRGRRRALLLISALACVLGLAAGAAVHATSTAHHRGHHVALAATFGDGHVAAPRAAHLGPALSADADAPAQQPVTRAAAVQHPSAESAIVDSLRTRGPPTGS